MFPLPPAGCHGLDIIITKFPVHISGRRTFPGEGHFCLPLKGGTKFARCARNNLNISPLLHNINVKHLLIYLE